MKVRELKKLLTADGWELARQDGPHDVYTHPERPGRVIVPRHHGDIKPGTLRSIYREAGWGKP